MLNLLQHHVLLLPRLRETPQVHPHILSLLYLPHLRGVHAPLLPQLLIVLIHFIFPQLLLSLLIRQTMLVHLVYLGFLLGFIHDFLEGLRERVFLQVVLKDSLLSNRRLPYFVQVNLLIVRD